MEKIKINCPYAHLKNDYFVYLNVVARDSIRPLSSEEVFFLIENCTECNKDTEIEITENGNISGCPAIEKYESLSEKPGYNSFIKQKRNFLKEILAKEFKFILLKEQIIGLIDNPNLKDLFKYIKKYKKRQNKEQS